MMRSQPRGMSCHCEDGKRRGPNSRIAALGVCSGDGAGIAQEPARASDRVLEKDYEVAASNAAGAISFRWRQTLASPLFRRHDRRDRDNRPQ